MATLNIDKDLREALDARRITWAEAGEIRGLRKDRTKTHKKWERLSVEIEPLVERLDEIDDKLRPLEAKVKGEPDED